MIHIQGSPRSAVEMLYVLEATPCPRCGTHAEGDYKYGSGDSERGGREIVLRATCPACSTPRELHFHAADDVLRVKTPAFELGGPAPSTVLDPFALMTELDRLALLVPDLPPGGDLMPARRAIARALTTINELVKFLPAGAEDLPAAAFATRAAQNDHHLRPTRYRRSWLDAQKKRFTGHEKRYREAAAAAAPAAEAEVPTVGTLDPAALEAHLQWVRRGGKDAGRLVLRGLRAPGAKIGAKELSGAMLVDVVLDGADLSYATVGSAQLDQVSLRGAALASTSLAGSRIVDGTFDGAGMAHARLGDAALVRCSFAGAELDKSTWYRTRADRCTFTKARFGNAALDEAVFTDCDFRGAELALRAPQPLGTTFRTRFERCDLRDVDWTARSLGGAVMVDCKLGGGKGRPSADGVVTIERAEIGGKKLDGDAARKALGWP